MRDLLPQYKKTVVFLGRPDRSGAAQYNATGFLVAVDGILYLVTAKHVVIDPKTDKPTDENLYAYFNLKSGGIGSREIESIKYRFGTDWTFHENQAVDIATIPFGIDTEQDDVVVVPEEQFLTDLNQLLELYDVFFLSYQPGMEPEDRIMPIIRHGTIARMNVDGTFYIDGAAFPGNSGSPVFLKPSVMRFDQGGGLSIGGDTLGGKFIGIIGSYITYQDVAYSRQTGNPRVVFEENTGLSTVWSVDQLRQLMESKVFKDQLTDLKEMMAKAE